MKTIIAILLVSITSVKAYSQISAVGIGKEFQSISGFGRTQSGFEGIQTYKTGNVNGSQFSTENWALGSVTTTTKEVMSNYLFLYDKVRQELFLKAKDTDLVVLADKNQVASFTIKSDKAHIYYHAEIYDPEQAGNFFEALVENENYTLLKLTKTTFEKANTNDMEKVKQGIFNDEFVDHVTYYIYYKNNTERITLNQHSLYKAFKDKRTKVDDFFTLYPNNEINEPLLINLVNYIN